MKPILIWIRLVGCGDGRQGPLNINKIKTAGYNMENDQNGYVTDYRSITIKTTDGSTINGKVNLTSKQRVSDLFTESSSPFLIMVDAVTRDGSGKILFVNKEHIVWAEPEE